MSMNKLWVGIDIASQTFTASVWHAGSQQSIYLGEFSNKVDGFETLCQALEPHQNDKAVVQTVLEATGGYETQLVAFAYQQQWCVCLPNAKLVRDFAKSTGQRNKNDREDANVLAQYGAVKRPAAQEMLAEELVELGQLQKRRQQLEKELRAERTRLKQWSRQPIKNAAVDATRHAVIHCFESELKVVEQAIKDLLKKHAEHKAMVKRLRTIPGVGPKNVVPLMLFLHRHEARTGSAGSRKSVVAYCGLDPQQYTSGRSIRKRPTISKMGDSDMRSYLFMGALGGVRGKNALRHFYQTMVERGKAKKLSLTAAARKILVWAYTIFSTKVDFDPTKHPISQVLA